MVSNRISTRLKGKYLEGYNVSEGSPLLCMTLSYRTTVSNRKQIQADTQEDCIGRQRAITLSNLWGTSQKQNLSRIKNKENQNGSPVNSNYQSYSLTKQFWKKRLQLQLGFPFVPIIIIISQQSMNTYWEFKHDFK